jgi:hypothetical protein
MNRRDKPPPPGYERHPLDPNLIRKIAPQTTGQVIWPNLPRDNRVAPVEQPRAPNVSAAQTIYPNLRKR